MRIKQLALGLVLGAVVTPMFAADYKIDPAHSFIAFRIDHLGMSWIYGTFNTVSGQFSWDEGNPGASSITVNIDPASVDTNHAERDKHVRSADMLNTDKYGEASFVSTGYSGDVNGGVIKGNLTVKGTTKPIEIQVERIGQGEDPWGNYRAGFHGTYVLTRADIGDGYNLGPAAETMEIQLNVEGIRQ